MYRHTYIVLFFSLLLIACSREESAQTISKEILFRVNTPEVLLTKAEVTDDNLSSAVVKVYESVVSSGILYGGEELVPEVLDGVQTGVWKPWSNPTWSSYGDNENLAFYAYAYLPKTAEDAGLTIKERGYEIVVSQPDTYSPDDNVDYLMSNAVRVPTDITKGKVIPLNLEHAMSKVELYVYCADAMESNESQTIEIDILDLYIEKIHTDVTMVYAPQSIDEKWTRSSYGSADGIYTCPDTFQVIPWNEEDPSGNMALGFIAVPVSNQRMEAVMHISYSIAVDGNDPITFNSQFNLADYTPSGWKSNHKIKYELKIDTGISLTGEISDWVEVDYIEGVILPEVEDE